MPIVYATDISCHKGHEALFEPVSFTVKSGQSLLISGPNGIGKTTLLQVIAGLSNPQYGDLFCDDQDLKEHPPKWYQQSIYIGHKTGNKKALNCLENLQLFLQIQNINVSDHHIEQALEKVGLGGYEYQMAGSLSAGQKKRLALCRLLLTDCPVWIVDEPFVNLDVTGCNWLLSLLKKHLDKDGLLIITAHDNQGIHDIATHNITLKAAS